MIRLFHSYQYISNYKGIFYDKEKKHFNDKCGKFKIGLLQIPNIPNHKIIIEKYLVAKRQSKKVNYRNHTKHNMKVFLTLTDNDLNEFIKIVSKLSSEYKELQLKYWFTLLKKNYGQYSLSQNIFDIICLNPSLLKISQSNLMIKHSLDVKLGNYTFDIINESYSFKKNLNKNTHTFLLEGGIFFSDTSIQNRVKILNIVSKSKRNILFYIDNEIEYMIWKQLIEENIKDTVNCVINAFNTNGYSIEINTNRKLQTDLFYILPHNVNLSNSSNLINFIKCKKKIKNLWFLNYDRNFFSIKNVSKILSFLINKNLNELIFSNIDNIYQLSKLIIPINSKNQSNDLEKPEIIKINKKFKNIIELHNKFKFNSDNTSKKNESCCICLNNLHTNKNLQFVETECKHLYCLECYLNHINIKIASDEISNVNCCLCRRHLHKKSLNFYFDLKTINHLNNIYKLIEGFSSNYDFVFFSKNFNPGYEYILNEIITYKINKKINIFDNQNLLINTKLNNAEKTIIFMLENPENHTAYQIFKRYNFKNCFMID
jgi:hypothetical protein